MVYVTSTGVELEIGRIHRSHIDKLIAKYPMPEPPMKMVQVWMIEEKQPDYKDSDYLAELAKYHATVGIKQLDVILPAISIRDSDIEIAEVGQEFAELGLGGDYKRSYLVQVAMGNEVDTAVIVGAVFYQSTVTQRGVDEAAAALAVSFLDKPVMAWKTPELPGKQSQLYGDMQAARFCHYNWQEFCDLPGPEQSMNVALHLITNRLEWLSNKFSR